MRKALLTYGLPFCVVTVVCIQFYNVHFKNLSRWKGGGFGMYSEGHPQFRQVWGFTGNKTIHFNDHKNAPKRLRQWIVRVQMWPSAKNLEHFAEQVSDLYKTDSVTIKVFEPGLNSGSNTLKMELVKECIYVQQN